MNIQRSTTEIHGLVNFIMMIASYDSLKVMCIFIVLNMNVIVSMHKVEVTFTIMSP